MDGRAGRVAMATYWIQMPERRHSAIRIGHAPCGTAAAAAGPAMARGRFDAADSGQIPSLLRRSIARRS